MQCKAERIDCDTRCKMAQTKLLYREDSVLRHMSVIPGYAHRGSQNTRLMLKANSRPTQEEERALIFEM